MKLSGGMSFSPLVFDVFNLPCDSYLVAVSLYKWIYLYIALKLCSVGGRWGNRLSKMVSIPKGFTFLGWNTNSMLYFSPLSDPWQIYPCVYLWLILRSIKKKKNQLTFPKHITGCWKEKDWKCIEGERPACKLDVCVFLWLYNVY